MGSKSGGLQEPHSVPRMWGSHLPLSPQLLCVGATVNSCAKASRWPWAQVWGGRGFWHLKKVSGKGRKVSKATGCAEKKHPQKWFGMMIWWLFFGVRGTIVSWKQNKHSQLFPAIFCDTFWGKPSNSFKTDDFALQVMIIHQIAVFLNIILQNRWLDRSGGDDIYIYI